MQPVTIILWKLQHVCFSRLLQWRHNEHDDISNHQPHDCLPKHLFKLRSKKTSKLCFTGLCQGKSPVTGEFLAQGASNAENVSIWWCHHVITYGAAGWWKFHQNDDKSISVWISHMILDVWYNSRAFVVCTLCNHRIQYVNGSVQNCSISSSWVI